ncbi:MAG: carbon-nitrogen hydrolase family protein [Syntrophobacterales bacterium]|jgi:predicted amidohydrolase|nr:carbon-nitrogen hydrolase family protein [Syntrophobacterales bacterium]
MAKIILIQALPAARLDSRENLARALKLLEACQGLQADLICFPEYFPFRGDTELAAAAARLEVYLVAGLLEEVAGKRYNTATLFDRRGRLQGRQRKHNLGNLERRGFAVTPGDQWQVWDTDFGRLGVPVCIDFWGQPEAARQLAAQGADLIVNPTIFPILRGHWQTGALTRAFDYYLPVVGVNTAALVAEIGGRRYPLQGGHSFAIQPPAPGTDAELAHQVREWDSLRDWLVLEAEETEGILTMDLDLAGPRRWRSAIRQRFGFERP